MSATLNCSVLATRDDFNSYARTLLNLTGDDLSLLNQCKVEVCSALWGQGNSDISGIGMIVGYVIDHILGLFLTVLTLVAASFETLTLGRVPKACLEAFRLCTTFFAFSIEIAAIVVLVREDFGISTQGMGDYTVRITQAVAMLVLLPLLYPLLVSAKHSQREGDRAAECEDSSENNENSSIQFTLFVFTWALAFYPFYSKMNAAFGPSKISSRPNEAGVPVLSPQQFEKIQDICFGNIKPITKDEDGLMTAFVMLTYIPISLYVLSCIIWGGVENNHPDSALYKRLSSLRKKGNASQVRYFVGATIIAIPLLATGLLWSILRVQKSQEALTIENGGTFQDSYWTFGQIVAVTVFMPVAVECWRSAKAERKSQRLDEDPKPTEKRTSSEGP